MARTKTNKAGREVMDMTTLDVSTFPAELGKMFAKRVECLKAAFDLEEKIRKALRPMIVASDLIVPPLKDTEEVVVTFPDWSLDAVSFGVGDKDWSGSKSTGRGKAKLVIK